MTVERVSIPGLEHDEQNTLDVLLTQLAGKTARNLLRAAYYDGKNAVRDLGISTPPSMKRIATVLGWSAKAVDILNRRCNLDGFVLPDGSADDFGMAEVWSTNYLDAEAPQAGVSSLIHATAFLIATQGDTEAGEPAALITAKDALSGTGVWNRRKRSLESFLSIIDTNDDGQPVEMVLYLPGLNVSMVKDMGVWKVDRRDHAYGLPVEPLVYQPRLGRPFGSSRISRAVMSSQDRATRILIRSEVTAEFYSAPQRVLLGADETAFKNADGTVKTAWQAILGRVWAIPDDEDADNPRAEIKEFTQASQQPHMDQLRAEAQLFSGETSIPLSSLGISGDANPTSEGAYEAGKDDLFAEAEGVTDGWSPAWRRTALRGLVMLNGWEAIPEEALALQPKWRDVRTQSRAAGADAALKLVQAGILPPDSEVTLEFLGFDPNTIARIVADRRRSGGSAALRTIAEAAAARQVNGDSAAG